MSARRGPGDRLHAHEYFICGMFTGAVVSFIEGPVDLVRYRSLQRELNNISVANRSEIYRPRFML